MTLHPRRDRVQTGVRMERRLVKVLKAVAELRDLSLGELLELMVYEVLSAAGCRSMRRAFRRCVSCWRSTVLPRPLPPLRRRSSHE